MIKKYYNIVKNWYNGQTLEGKIGSWAVIAVLGTIVWIPLGVLVLVLGLFSLLPLLLKEENNAGQKEVRQPDGQLPAPVPAPAVEVQVGDQNQEGKAPDVAGAPEVNQHKPEEGRAEEIQRS